MISSASAFPDPGGIDDKGRFFRNTPDAQPPSKSPKFVIRTVPDVDKNTRIIGVCGTEDEDTEYEVADFDAPEDQAPTYKSTGAASPMDDGWFVSDFYAFLHLLKNAGASQKWITTDDPAHLVRRYTMYLHGNPYSARKVVLNKDMVDSGIGNRLTRPASGVSLKQSFIDHLTQEADAARKGGQSLLILIFAHSDEYSKGVMLGPYGYNSIFYIDELKQAVGEDLDITILSAACYPGGWVINKSLNTSTMAAAGSDRESESWPQSPSIGRYCGGFFATALFKAWNEESDRAEADSSATGSSSQSPQTLTYAAFTETVYDALYSIDKFADGHEIAFSTQDDGWAAAWGERTGLPLVDFKRRWDELPTIAPTADVTSSLNRHLATSSEKDSSPHQSGSLRGRFGNVNMMANHVQAVARIYLMSHPGPSNAAPNIALHGVLRQLFDGNLKITVPAITHIYNQIRFRTDLMELATQLLKAAHIPLPEGVFCSSFDVAAFEAKTRQYPQHDNTRKYAMAKEKIFITILPDPNVETQGRRWNKPHRYIAAALALDQAIKTPADLEAAIARLEKVMC